MNAAKAVDPSRSDLLLKTMAESFMPADEGLADRCYYIPGKMMLMWAQSTMM